MATRKKKYKPTARKGQATRGRKKVLVKVKQTRPKAKPKAKPKLQRSKPQKVVKRRRNKKGQFLPLKKRDEKRLKKIKVPRKRKPYVRKSKRVEKIKRPKTTFRKIRRKNQKKIPKPTRPKRRGKIIMRGAEGQERSIVVKKFWDHIRRGLLEEEIMRVYASLLQYTYRTIPSLYSRFTFSVSHVETIMSAGSPKLLGIKHGNIKAWFFSTGMAMNLYQARAQLSKGLGVLEDTISDAQDENPNAEFFLEFVTVRAYVVKVEG